MSNSNTTPKSLTNAIRAGFDDRGLQKKLTDVDAVCVHVRDFLAQRFSAALLDGNDDQVVALERLWTSITGEKLR